MTKKGGSFSYIPSTMDKIKSCYEDKTHDPLHVNNLVNKRKTIEFPTCGQSKTLIFKLICFFLINLFLYFY